MTLFDGVEVKMKPVTVISLLTFSFLSVISVRKQPADEANQAMEAVSDQAEMPDLRRSD
jgi:hypothetical protein